MERTGDRVNGGTDGSDKWRDMSVERPAIGLVEGYVGGETGDRVNGGICRWRDRR